MRLGYTVLIIGLMLLVGIIVLPIIEGSQPLHMMIKGVVVSIITIGWGVIRINQTVAKAKKKQDEGGKHELAEDKAI